jgi:hypothetical protein
MSTIKGIISFPTIFIPEVAKGATEPKYTATLLLPPTDPQLPAIQAEYNAAALEQYPSGVPAGTNVCFALYDAKYQGKEYYDPRFSGWHVLSCSAKATDKPHVVGMDHQPITDPGAVPSGTVVWLNMGMSGYSKGVGGIGGWLNGVMSSGEVDPVIGRLDGKLTPEQMFPGGGAPAAAPGAVAPPVAPAAPAAPPAAPMAPPAAPAAKVMTATATNTYDEYIAAGWDDAALIANGLMIQPSFA